MEENYIETVRNINSKISGNFPNSFWEELPTDIISYPPELVLHSDGDAYSVEFLGFYIYDNINEMREWDEKLEIYTPDLETYLIEKIKKIREIVSMIEV